MNMGGKIKPIVIFYSLTGNTKKLAREISKILNCDVEELIDLFKMLGPLGRVLAGRFHRKKRFTRIKDIKCDLRQNDIIIMGTPVWGDTMAGAIRSFITNYHSQIKHVAFFCTFANNSGRVFKDMETLCKKKPIGLLGLGKVELKKEDFHEKINDFVKGIKKELIRLDKRPN